MNELGATHMDILSFVTEDDLKDAKVPVLQRRALIRHIAKYNGVDDDAGNSLGALGPSSATTRAASNPDEVSGLGAAAASFSRSSFLSIFNRPDDKDHDFS